MMGISDVVLGVILVVVVLGGVLLYALIHQRTAIDESKTPSLPPQREPDPGVSAGKPGHVVVELHVGSPLAEQLRTHANKAEARKLRPFLEVGAQWCPPSRIFGEALTDPRMHAALAGVYLIRVDMDELGSDPKLGELGVRAVPVFYELDADGQATGRTMTGDAWGADTVDNMSAALTKFCA